MKKFDYWFLSIIYLPIFPIFLFLIFWWGSFSFLPENRIAELAFAGLFIGILIDIFYLKKWLKKGYDQKNWLLALIYLFYSIGLFGMLMGLPIFNVLIGAVAGVFIARKANLLSWNRETSIKWIKKTAWFSVLVLACACVFAAYFSLSDPYIKENLLGMFGLNFTLTNSMMLALVIGGGLLLLIFQYWLTKFIGIKILKKN